MSNKKLYVGNLPFDATTEDVRAAFAAFGTVHDVQLITDRDTGRPRGFGFVEMDAQSASAAIESLNNKIETINTENRKPVLKINIERLNDRIKELLNKDEYKINISLSHEKEYSIAQVIIY